jgi:hypothetical protein
MSPKPVVRPLNRSMGATSTLVGGVTMGPSMLPSCLAKRSSALSSLFWLIGMLGTFQTTRLMRFQFFPDEPLIFSR